MWRFVAGEDTTCPILICNIGRSAIVRFVLVELFALIVIAVPDRLRKVARHVDASVD
jgi:hypothetical protein